MEVLKPGNILRIPNYEFENGGESRDKYLIVIDISEESSLFLRVLTTSQIKVPEDKAIHGCRNEPENGLHYFMFEKKRCIGTYKEQDFHFPKHTFILFRNNIKNLDLVPFINKYKDVTECVCHLQTDEFTRLKKCIRQNSRMADRSAKRSFPHIFE
jgi:hypothetical protein